MTIFLKKGHPTVDILKKNNINIIEEEFQNFSNDTVLKIGIINIMPKANEYEPNLLISLATANKDIQPVWIKLDNHKYKTTPPDHLGEYYTDFKTALKLTKLDGVVLTGAPVEHLEFETITYWQELKNNLNYLAKNKIPVLGLCWGGLALGNILGLKQDVYSEKVFGVFPSTYIKNDWNSNIEETQFHCPHSRFAGYNDKHMESSENDNKLTLLAHGENAGYFIFESKNKLMLAHIGHSEYHKNRLVEEAVRDKELQREDVKPPVNFDINKPVNIWKNHRTLFFSYWFGIIENKKVI